MTEYVLVFVFSLDRERVLLIRKNRPEGQAGSLNGLGGKIEKGEKPLDAAYRKLEEESGLDPFKVAELLHFAVIEGDGYRVFCYRSKTDWVGTAQSMTSEAVAVYDVRQLLQDVNNSLIHNLNYILPLALHLPSNTAPVLIAEGLTASPQSVKNLPKPGASA